MAELLSQTRTRCCYSVEFYITNHQRSRTCLYCATAMSDHSSGGGNCTAQGEEGGLVPKRGFHTSRGWDVQCPPCSRSPGDTRCPKSHWWDQEETPPQLKGAGTSRHHPTAWGRHHLTFLFKFNQPRQCLRANTPECYG